MKNKISFSFTLMLFASIVMLFLLSSSKWITLPQFPGAKGAGGIAAYDDSTYIVSIRMNSNITYTLGQVFYITSDYGNTWDSVYSTIRSLFDQEWTLNAGAQFQYVGKDSIYAYNVLTHNKLLCFYKTLDNGKTWDTTMVYHDGGLRRFEGMYFKNPLEGIISLFGQYMIRTNDGGDTWSLDSLPKFDDQYAPEYFKVYDIAAIQDTILVSIIDENASEYNIRWKKLLFSTDFGKTWEIINDAADTASIIATSCELRSADEWWVFGRSSYDINKGGQIFVKKTTDRGKTWQFIDKGGEIFYGIATQVYFFGENQIRFGTTRHVYYSTDNGETWGMEEGQEDNYFGSTYVAYPSFDRGMSVHHYGFLYKLVEDPMSVSESNADIQSTTLIYPNPTAEVIYLDNLDTGVYHDYEIINLEGIKVQEGVLRANSVRVDRLPAGVYHLMLLDENNPPQVKKFVKK